jgi:hypothetical protein
VALAIAFGVCNFRSAYNAAGVLEWAIAFIFTFYVLSFFIDLLPAVRTKHARFPRGGQTQMQQEWSAERGTVGRGFGGRLDGGRDSEQTVGRNEVVVLDGPGKRYPEGAPVASNF